MEALNRTLTIKAGGEARVDWRVRVAEEGEAVVRMKALSDEESDAMEMRFPALVHGMLKTDSFSGNIRPETADATGSPSASPRHAARATRASRSATRRPSPAR